jgi:hypothetical protein
LAHNPLAQTGLGVIASRIDFTAFSHSSFCKPLLTLPVTTVGVAAERDLVNQLASMPRIQDGACLNWLVFVGGNTAANTVFQGAVETAWG